MSEEIKLYSPDYSQILLTTDDRDTANQFLRDSGENRLPMVIDFGERYSTRWSGHLILGGDGAISTCMASEFLEYITHWPNPFISVEESGK